MSVALIAGVTIVTDTDSFTVGSRTVATCFSDAGVADRMQWLSGTGLVLATATSVQQLDLTFDPVNDTLSNMSEFTCSVTRDENSIRQRVITKSLPIFIGGTCTNCMHTT